MVRLAGRLDRLERHAHGDPRDVRECERFLTALIAFGQLRERVTPEMATEIRSQARRIGGGGGLFAHMRDLAATLREGRVIRCD